MALYRSPDYRTSFICSREVQGSLIFPWLFPEGNSNFPDNIGAANFMILARKIHWDPTSCFIRLKCKILWHFPDIFAKFHFSPTFLQNFIFPWHTEFPDNSLTLKKIKFPWHVWTLKKFSIDFQDGSHLVFPIRMILATFDLQVTNEVSSQLPIFGSGKNFKIDFQYGG